jgi:hypothetical protein
VVAAKKPRKNMAMYILTSPSAVAPVPVTLIVVPVGPLVGEIMTVKGAALTNPMFTSGARVMQTRSIKKTAECVFGIKGFRDIVLITSI